MRMSGRRLTASKKNTPPASGHQRRPAGSIQRSHRRRPQGGRNIAYTPPRGAMSSSVSQSLMRATDSHRRRQGTSPDSASKLHGLKPITSNRPCGRKTRAASRKTACGSADASSAWSRINKSSASVSNGSSRQSAHKSPPFCPINKQRRTGEAANNTCPPPDSCAPYKPKISRKISAQMRRFSAAARRPTPRRNQAAAVAELSFRMGGRVRLIRGGRVAGSMENSLS